MATNFYSEEELQRLGFKSIGKNVKISKKATIYGASKMSIGSNVRIDDFCVLSGNIDIGNYIHISIYSGIQAGEAGVVLEDFTGLSTHCMIFAESDDYSGMYLTNPTVDAEFRGGISKKVYLRRHVILGSGTTVLPGVEIGEGTAVGSMSLVTKSLEPWGVYAGIPCKYIKPRLKDLLEKEQLFLEKQNELG